MKKYIILLSALASCKPGPFTEAETAVRATLKDPDSAKFSGEFIGKWYVATSIFGKGTPHDVVCGHVNAKNSYGGYVGDKRFVVNRGNVEIEGSGGFTDQAVLDWSAVCAPYAH